MLNVFSIINDDTPYTIQENIIHFILHDSDRPWWSKQLEGYFTQGNIKLNMPRNYKSQKQIMTSNPSKKRFIDYISDVQGVKIDLASGPSGYFSAVLDNLTEDDLFIATDACPTVVCAHSKACNKNNFYVFDMDLDQNLPLKEASVDIFSGNLLNNVNNYASLIQEVYRCLKPGGRLALIEMFFEHGCKTYEHLNSKGEIWASFETFVSFCEKVGFTYLDGDIIFSRKGKISKDDLYPLDENDCWTDRILYFVKSN